MGIGASAGGLAALKHFFENTSPGSGIAFVVVVHLAPEHKSHLADLLQPYTQFPVQQVTETTLLEPNHVYVIPPNANINTIDTHLRLSELEERRAQRAPIDHFLRTLATTHDGSSVAVILTGTGSDGTLGVRDIKAKGGFVIVQDPREAEYDGMPQSAIATGMVDLVLPVAEIPEAILRINRTEPRVMVPADGEDLEQENRVHLQNVFAVLHAQTERDFSRYKRSTILRRVARRMQINYIDDLTVYLDRLRREPEEVRALADDLLITVTNFFRDPPVFEKLAKDVIPQLFEGRTSKDSIRVWSVGCATGEEAYSIAILLLEEAGRRDEPPEIQIFASDLHSRSLTKAREGFYPGDIETDLTPERVRRFFNKENGGFRIRKELRDLVVFAPHNLLGDPPFSRIDLVSCRNLLIYLEREVQRAVIELFHYSLNPEGTLLLGSAETIESSDLFRVDDKRLCVFRKRNVPTLEPRLPVFPLTRSRLLGGERSLKGLVLSEPVAVGKVHQRLVELYAPPSVLISPDDNVVHLSKHAGNYLNLPGGELTANIFRLVRDELRFELQGLLQTARQKKEPVGSKPIPLEIEGRPASVLISVRPALEPQQEGFALIIFDDRLVPSVASVASPQDAGTHPDAAARNRQLEIELEISQQRARTIIEQYETAQEEMKASNEEMQSSNEEIRSTMEELETSKEELQSINEELQTVNQENRHKVEELAQLSNDLQNLLSATGIATLFLDRNLRILRFTPKLSDLFNIRTTDRGRPISDQTHRLGYAELESDAQSVLDNLLPIEREVQDEKGQWYLTRVLPYRSSEDRIEGVVITFVDITRRVSAETALRGSEKRLSAELDAMQRLHDLAARLLVSSDLTSALQTVLKAAVEIMGAQMGNTWILNPSTNTLETVVTRGITPEHLDHFRAIDEASDSARNQAFQLGRRVVISDVQTDPFYGQSKAAAIAAGYRAAQFTPLVSRDGKVLGILATHFTEPHLPSERDLRILDLYTRQAADFVERRRSEETLRRSEERYRLLIESAREYAILMLDVNGRVATWNSGAERIFGYRESEIVGRPVTILFTQEDQHAGAPENEMRTALAEKRAADDRWQVRKDGTCFWASGVMGTLDSDGEGPQGFVKVLRDNTERKQAEENLLAQERHLLVVNEALSRANAGLKEFAFAASHDLREPLRSISAYTKILIDASLQGKKREAEMAARFITEGAERMSQLLADLLTYTQLTVDEDDVSEPVDLNAVIKNTLENLNILIEQSGAAITCDTLPVVRGHASNFVQLFQNLIANAIKYRSERPLTIQIFAEKVADKWRFTIRDNGIGIASEYHEKIFGVFKRLHGSKIPGTGIGLAICQRIVERFGGSIWVESAVDQGSAFILTIPVAEDLAKASPAVASIASSKPGAAGL